MADSPTRKPKIHLTTPPLQEKKLSHDSAQVALIPFFQPPATDWERTAEAKLGWLSYFSQNLVSVTRCCEVMHIGRRTFYDWVERDPEFKAAYYEAEAMQNDSAEDRLFDLMRSKDGASIRFHLERRTDKWKARQVLEHHVGNITLEDLLDADNAKANAQNEARTDRGAVEDSQQTESNSAIPFERGTDVLLEP